MDVDEEELYDENDEMYEDGAGKGKFQFFGCKLIFQLKTLFVLFCNKLFLTDK